MIKTRSDATQVWVVNQGAGAGSTSIVNSAGWVVNIGNSAGWVFAQSNTSPLVQVQNSAGWIVNVANTGGSVVVSNTVNNVGIINSANWIVYTIDSRPTGTLVQTIASSTASTTLASADPLRRTLSVYNRSTNPLYLKLGASATTADFTLMMVASGYYEIQNPVYVGDVTGIWGAANGNALVTIGT